MKLQGAILFCLFVSISVLGQIPVMKPPQPVNLFQSVITNRKNNLVSNSTLYQNFNDQNQQQ